MFINLIFLILVIVPISLFIHELGHLLGAKFLKADRVTIYLGAGRKLFTLSFKKMTLNLSLLIMFNAHTQSERKQNFTNKELAFITMMGPLFSLIFTGVFSLLFIITTSELIFYFFLFNLWLAVINLVPFKTKNQKSDGYLIWNLLK